MIDRKQIEAMIEKARSLRANVTVSTDQSGYPHQISVTGIAGIGPHPMGVIGFAEAMHRVGLGVGPNGQDYAARDALNSAPAVVAAEHDGFAIGERVTVAGCDGEWVIADILLEEAGVINHQPFRLRSVWRDDAEGYPTTCGTIAFQSSADRHIWIWASSEALAKLTAAPTCGM